VGVAEWRKASVCKPGFREFDQHCMEQCGTSRQRRPCQSAKGRLAGRDAGMHRVFSPPTQLAL